MRGLAGRSGTLSFTGVEDSLDHAPDLTGRYQRVAPASSRTSATAATGRPGSVGQST